MAAITPSTPYGVSKNDRRELWRMRDKLDGIRGGRGIIVGHSPTGLAIHAVGSGARGPLGGPRLFQITGATQDGARFRWAYTGRPVIADATGNFLYAVGNETVTLINTLEIDNDASTAEGAFQSGIPMGNGVTGILPIRLNSIVEASVFAGGRWYFTLRNVETIDCAEVTQANGFSHAFVAYYREGAANGVGGFGAFGGGGLSGSTDPVEIGGRGTTIEDPDDPP